MKVGEPLDRATFERLATGGVPLMAEFGCEVVRFEPGRCNVRLPYRDLFVRPGGTVCGPALMALADITLYGVVLSLIGRVELAVTTDLTIHFLQKPRPGALIAQGRILRQGRTLAVAEVTIRPVGAGDEAQPVAHAVGTYAIPPGPALDTEGRGEPATLPAADAALVDGGRRPGAA